MPYSDPFTTCTTRYVSFCCFSVFLLFSFLDQHYNPTYLTSPPHHTSHGICAFFLLQDNFKKEEKKKEKSLLQVVQLSVLAVQAAAGGHLSKYITVI